MVADSSSLVFHRDPEAVFADLIEKGHEAEWQGAHVLESRSEDHRRGYASSTVDADFGGGEQNHQARAAASVGCCTAIGRETEHH
jgi:hypothetical protein